MDDIRWKQRFVNYKKALSRLESAVRLLQEKDLSDLEKSGVVQHFEFTWELAWKTLQDYLRDQGYTDIAVPTSVIRQAFKDGYITDGESWMDMKKSRDLAAHTYDEDAVDKIVVDIAGSFFGLLKDLEARLGKQHNI